MGYILIIGAKSDIAKALARKYAEKGYDLYLAARNVDTLKSFASDLNIRYEQKVVALELDVLDFDRHEAFYESLDPTPEGVIAVVGYLGEQETAENSFVEAKKIIDTNYSGPVSLLNIAAKHMTKKKSGFIVGISSVAGDRGRKSNYLYGSAKAGFSTYLSGLRNSLVAAGVHVLTVKPGFVATQMTAHLDLPPRLTAQPNEVANAIFKAQQQEKNTLYTKWFWRYIMLIIKVIPEFIFKKLNL